MESRYSYMMLATALILLSGGCCSNRENLVHSGHMSVENYSPGKVKILSSDAYDQNGLFVVKGILKREDHAAVPTPVHVHVLVLSDDNRILQSLRTSLLHVPPKRPGQAGHWTRFEVTSAVVPRQGSRLLIIAHNQSEPHSDEDLRALVTSHSG